MDIKALVEELKAKGTGDEEIAKILTDIKNEIDAVLGAGAEEKAPEKVEEEQPDDKEKRIFGI